MIDGMIEGYLFPRLYTFPITTDDLAENTRKYQKYH